jgi:hypothetical protein
MREWTTTLRDADVLEMLSHCFLGTQSFDVVVSGEKATRLRLRLRPRLRLIHKTLPRQTEFLDALQSIKWRATDW